MTAILEKAVSPERETSPAASASTSAASGGLASALASFQAEVPNFHKTKTAKVETKSGGSYSYKYADLADIVPVVGPLLAKYGLSWSSKPARAEDGELVLRYRLLHTSGEADGDEMPLGVSKGCKPQELGSAITYARRYALTAQLNLVTDEDDDGQAAQNAHRTSNAKPKPKVATEAMVARIYTSADARKMPNRTLAKIVLTATGNPEKEWADEEQAGAWLERALKRLPEDKVARILTAITGAV